jgi:hypothetical protein
MTIRNSIRTALLTVVALILVLTPGLPAHAQAVSGNVSPEDPPPPVTFNGLIPGLDTLTTVRKKLGLPEFEAFWYSYKMLYPSQERPGTWDALHLRGNKPDSVLANIEAASIPNGYEFEPDIRRKLGDPEYELRMSTWKLLDYSEQGVRFTLDKNGKTTGVAYFPHGNTRVPGGERSLMDLTHLRLTPEPNGDKLDLKGLRVGTAEVVISPVGEDWLARPYEIHDDLKARVAVFSDGGLTVAIVGADVFGMGINEVRRIRTGAANLGVDTTVFAMSHTHSGGDTTGVYGHYPADYISHIQDRTVAGIEEALDNLAPVVELRSAARELPMDGARVMGLIRNARNPAVMDPTISILQAIGEDETVLTTIVHFACHPESVTEGDTEMSADFPGYMCDALDRAQFGQPVFLNGALGGMVSGDNNERTHASSERTGREFAQIVTELADEAEPHGRYDFSVATSPLHLPLTNERFQEFMQLLSRPLERGRVVTDMTYVQLGEAQIITLPGELLPEVSFEILERMDGFPRMLIGLGNDQLGYIIPPYDWRSDEYEESMSVGPASAYQVRDMALRMIRESM